MMEDRSSRGNHLKIPSATRCSDSSSIDNGGDSRRSDSHLLHRSTVREYGISSLALYHPRYLPGAKIGSVSQSMSGAANILPTGQLQFMPQEHILCGLCETSFMFCLCTGLTHGRNYVFANLPPPAANSTRSQLIQRWCSIVAMHPTMGVFGADEWFCDQGEALSVSMNERTSMLHDLVEAYIQQLPQDETLSNLALIAGGKNMTRKSKAEQVKAVAAEARASMAIFLSGDWACSSYFGPLLINNAFQTSDPQRFPLNDSHLRVIFESGIGLLRSVMDLGYDRYGYRLAMELDRRPVGTSLASCRERFAAARV